MNGSLFLNSLAISLATAVIGCAFGFLVALAVLCAGTPWRRVLLTLTVAALMVPVFVTTNCWLQFAGPKGFLQPWINLFSRTGAVGLLTLSTWPIATLFVVGSWTRLERSQLESESPLYGWTLIRWLLWPMARGATGYAGVLIFVLAFNNFAVPVILQIPVFPEELWLALTTRLDESGAWMAAAPLVLIPFAAVLLWRHADVSWPRMEGPVSPRDMRRHLSRLWRGIANGATAALTFLSVMVPMGQLFASPRTWSEVPNLVRSSPDVIANSFLYAVSTATFGVIVGWFSRRWKLGPWPWILFFTPGILLGRAMIYGFNTTVLAGSFAMVLLTLTLHYVAPARLGVVMAWQAMDSELLDAARLGGARGWFFWRGVLWPQLAAPIALTWYLVYLLALAEVESLVLIYPPGGETLALRAFHLLHYGHNIQVNAICVLTLALGLLPLIAWESWSAFAKRRDSS